MMLRCFYQQQQLLLLLMFAFFFFGTLLLLPVFDSSSSSSLAPHAIEAAFDKNDDDKIIRLTTRPSCQQIHLGWKARRCPNLPDDPSPLGCTTTTNQLMLMNVSSLPTTALLVLLENNMINISTNNGCNTTSRSKITTPNNLYFGQNMANIPDINETGRDYYTLVYQRNISGLIVLPQKQRNNNSRKDYYTTRKTLRFDGINYQAKAWLNGGHNVLEEIAMADDRGAPGMNRRRYYDVTTGGTFQILVEPPFHPGWNSGNGQQQGGNHYLAKDGTTPQFMLGWDWCQPMPDRSTGIYGNVYEHITGPYAVLDPAIQTVSLKLSHHRGDGEEDDVSSPSPNHNSSNITLRILARIECVDVHIAHHHAPQYANRYYCTSGEKARLSVRSDWGEIWHVDFTTTTMSNANTTTKESQSSSKPKSLVTFFDVDTTITVQKPELVTLWWPHGLFPDDNQTANLHRFTFQVYYYDTKHNNNNCSSSDNSTILVLSDERTIHVGIRTVDTYLDEDLQGQVFLINHHKVYLVGGNWIATDQVFRASTSSVVRYCNEISLHKHAGINLLRVWGGASTERDQFYDCADQLGVLVLQEFWMTGDNNGRWAGNYSWPLNHAAYLANVRDTILRLRRHPSLLFYCGCNECSAPSSSKSSSPPRDIVRGIQEALDTYDTGRFFISSSMNGQNKADTFQDPTVWFNRSYGLSYADGPYSMLLPSTYFERNPGLPYKHVKIGFQPEVGSASAPTYEGLLRFMTKEQANTGFPRRYANNSQVGDAWKYHKFQSWVVSSDNSDDDNGDAVYDHVYAYFGNDYPVNASEWAAGAQLAAHVQYQSLLNGFVSHLFEYTSAVIMWKTQSPWPSLRGFLYDWYMETTGALRGVRASLRHPVSIVLDLSLWRLVIVNRSLLPLRREDIESAIGARLAWIDLHGRVVRDGVIYLDEDVDEVPSMSAHLLSDSDELKWPNDCSSVCFLCVSVLEQEKNTVTASNTLHSPQWYWLTDPALGHRSDYSALGRLREEKLVRSSLHIISCTVGKAGTEVEVEITVQSTSPVVLFYPTFSVAIRATRALNRNKDKNLRSMLPLLDANETDVVILPGQIQKRQLQSPGGLHDNHGTPIVVTMTSWNGPSIQEQAICTDSSHAVTRTS